MVEPVTSAAPAGATPAAVTPAAMTEEQLTEAIESTLAAAHLACQPYFLALAELWLPGVKMARTESSIVFTPVGTHAAVQALAAPGRRAVGLRCPAPRPSRRETARLDGRRCGGRAACLSSRLGVSPRWASISYPVSAAALMFHSGSRCAGRWRAKCRRRSHRAADCRIAPPRGRGARTAREISGRPSPGALPQKADQAGIAGRGRLPQVPLQDLDGWLWGHLAGSFG